jgi:TonB-dependent receptor
MRSVLLLILFACFASTLFAQGTGTIRGKVTDEDNFSLAGANVYIKELRKGTATDKNGEFTLLNVPAGTQTLTFSYLGYRTETMQLTVDDGRVAEASVVMQSGVIRGEEVVILGERLKGQARSLNQQRNNPNITNVVSSDQIGRFPDANIGDALKRIPAITVNYDQGEARFANIRGTEPRLNSIMVNGERIPSAEGEIRAVQVDLIPSDAIASIEVSKAVTPDMDADAIGGAVNLITRGAPNDLRLSATLGSGYNMLSEEPMFIGSAVVGSRFLDDRVGIMLSGAYHNHQLGSHNAEGEWDIDDNGNVFVDEWEVRKYEIQRLRQSVSGTVDFKLDPANTLFLRGIYNHRNDWENRFAVGYGMGEPSGGVFDETEIVRETKGGIGNDLNDNARLEDQRMYNLSLSGDHLFGGLLKVDWMASYAKASEERPNERYIAWVVEDIPVSYDISDAETPYFNPLNPDDVALGNFELDELTEEYQYTDEIDINARLDLEIPLVATGMYKNTVKFGGRMRSKEKKRENDFYEYEPLGDFLMTDTGIKDYSVDDFLAGDYRSGYFTSDEGLGALDLNNPALFEKTRLPEEFAADNYTATEDILAGYVQLNQHIGSKLFLIAGVRLEQTNIEYEGNQFNDETEEITPTSGSDDYLNVLPGLHLKYMLESNTILRFAWTNTLARPNYYDLVPFRAIAVEDEELEVGNPTLEPTRSMNFDIMAEQYFESVGIVSGGLFYKDITDFIYIYSEDDYVDPVSGNTYEFFQPRNGAEATLLGFEFAFQRQLTFLPGFLANTGIYLNYTFTTSTTDNPDFPEDQDVDLPGAAPHTLNAALTYQTPRLVVGISFNYTSPYLDPDDLDLSPGLERYYDAVTYLDANASFAITQQLRVFVEANNLLNQPLRYYAGDSFRTYQAEFYNRRFTAGIKFDL